MDASVSVCVCLQCVWHLTWRVASPPAAWQLGVPEQSGYVCQVPHSTTLTSHGSQWLSHLQFWLFKKYFPKLYLALCVLSEIHTLSASSSNCAVLKAHRYQQGKLTFYLLIFTFSQYKYILKMNVPLFNLVLEIHGAKTEPITITLLCDFLLNHCYNKEKLEISGKNT